MGQHPGGIRELERPRPSSGEPQGQPAPPGAPPPGEVRPGEGGGAHRRSRQEPAFGMPNTNPAPPSGKWSWKLPPAATATNCSPSTENTEGAALTPAPH